MAFLHNRIGNKLLKLKLQQEQTKRITLSFYKYFHIPLPTAFRDQLYKQFRQLNIFGRVYLAEEGINAQISVPEVNFTAFKSVLFNTDPMLNGLRLNIALEDDGKSFWVLRMRVRHRIVADGINDPSFDASKVGNYINAQQVNQMVDDPEVTFVDMRNDYEYEVGHFVNATKISAQTFRQQLPAAVELLQPVKEKKIVMYCTGGIRCEKASAFLRHHGFTQVFHVEGGIIEYVRQAKQQGLPLKFIGKNFVFDQRMGERITNDIISQCAQCAVPADNHKNCKNDICHHLFIQCNTCDERYAGCCSEACQIYYLKSKSADLNHSATEGSTKIEHNTTLA